jgi:hypothetical protein
VPESAWLSLPTGRGMPVDSRARRPAHAEFSGFVTVYIEKRLSKAELSSHAQCSVKPPLVCQCGSE